MVTAFPSTQWVMACIGLMMLISTMVSGFSDDEWWSPVATWEASNASAAAPAAPASIRSVFCNVNGCKSKAAKRHGMRDLHAGLITVSTYDIAEWNETTKSQQVDDTTLVDILRDIAPYGRGWATNHCAATWAATMNGIPTEVASALDGRVLRSDFLWGDEPETRIVVYAPQRGRPEFFRRLAECVPADRNVTMSGDFNCIPNTSRDQWIADDLAESAAGEVIQSHSGNEGAAELIAVAEILQLHDLAPSVADPGTDVWFTFEDPRVKTAPKYARRLDHIYMSGGALARVDAKSFHTVDTCIAGVDHRMLECRVDARPAAAANDNVFPPMSCEIIFWGDFIDTVRGFLLSAVNGAQPEDHDAEGWRALIDDLTRRIQDLYVDHKKAWRKWRGGAVRAARAALERFDREHADAPLSESFFDERRDKQRCLAAVIDKQSEQRKDTADIEGREYKSRAIHTHRAAVQPMSGGGIFKSQQQFVPPAHPEQSLEHVDGALGCPSGWIGPIGSMQPIKAAEADGSRPDLTDEAEIIANTELFWSHQYSPFLAHEPCQRFVLERVAECTRVLPPDTVALMAALLTIAEVRDAIMHINTGKSPGPSGIPAELYQALADLFAILLTKQYNACYVAGGGMSELQRQGRIAMLFKAGIRAALGNWRPISNLQKDFQIMSQVLNSRIENIVSMLTGMDQTGFTAGRLMSETIRKWQDGGRWAQQKGVACAKNAYDWKKAYDNVSLPFLYAVIDLMCGVPLHLVLEDLAGAMQAAAAADGPPYVYRHSSPLTKWVQMLYTGHERCISVNGTTTNFIKLFSSCPQGCISAPRLFVLFIEPLGILFRTDGSISGIILPSGREIRVGRFADDTGSQIAAPIQDNRRHFSPTLRTRGLRQCAALTQALSHAIGQGMNLIAIFGAASGMVNNQAKGEGCWEGTAQYLTQAWEHGSFDGALSAYGEVARVPWKRRGTPIKLLGVRSGHDLDPQDEWKKVVDALLVVLRIWSATPLGIRARCDVAKSLAWSKAWFLAVYVEMPASFLKLAWNVTKHYVVKGFVPAGITLESRVVPRSRISELDMMRPIWAGGLDSWRPEDFFVAQDAKAAHELLSFDEPYAVRHSKRFPTCEHASWRELAWLFVDRLNWDGSARARVAGAAQIHRQSLCHVIASTVLPLGDLLTVHTCDGVFEVATSSCHIDGAVIAIMITAEMKREAQLGGQPGLVVDYTECNRRYVPRGHVALIEGVNIRKQLKKQLDMPPTWLKTLKNYGKLHEQAHILPPTTAEEVMSMPVFGSPWILQAEGGQFQPRRGWEMWTIMSLFTIRDLWNIATATWASGYAVLHRPAGDGQAWGFPPSSAQRFPEQLLLVHRSVPQE